MTRPCPRCGAAVVLAELPPRERCGRDEARFALLDATVTATTSAYARVPPYSAARFVPTSSQLGHALHWLSCSGLSATERAWSRRFPLGDLPPRAGEVSAFLPDEE